MPPPKKWRMILVLLVSISSLTFATLGGSGPLGLTTPGAWAASSCSTSSYRNFDGVFDSQDYGYGSSAYILNDTPAFCTNPPNNPLSVDHITAWSMITNNTASEYAQTGWIIHLGESQPEIFSEYSTNNNAYCGNSFCDVYGPQLSNGQFYQYWEVYDNSWGPLYNGIYMGYGSTTLNFTPYDPTQTGVDHWNGPWLHQYFGENLNDGDNVPGRTGNEVAFSSVSWVPNPDSNRARPPATSLIAGHTGYHTQDYYCENATAAYQFTIWTDGYCPSTN